MKRLMILLVFITLGLTVSTNAESRFNYGGFELFYSSLTPYGTWIQIDGGINVWRPLHMSRGWMPYKYGRWIWTNDGWYWQSDEPFGYIVFHYGRWYYDDYYGWIWIPDDVWAPAWVQWRYDNDYIGWAPLSPYATFSVGFGIRFTTGYVTPYRYWHFVKYRYLCDRDLSRYYIPERYKYRIYSNSRYRTNYGYSDGRVINRGVDVDFIRKRSGARIVERNIERTDNERAIRERGDRNSGPVRAYIINRNNSRVKNNRNYEIKRGIRGSSLDFNRVEMGRSERLRNERQNNLQRTEPGRIKMNNDRNRNPEIRDRGNRNDRRTIPNEIRKQNSQRSGRDERIIRNERRNESRNVRPQVRRENSERRAPDTRHETRDRRENNTKRHR